MNRIHEFPRVKLNLEFPSQISLSETTLTVKGRVTYVGVSTPAGTAAQTPSKPITIHLSNMTNSMDCRYGKFIFERWNFLASMWEEVPGNDNFGFMLLDNPPLRVKIGDRGNQEFLTLHKPGDSTVVVEETVYQKDAGESFLSYARDVKVGDRFRIRYTSTTLDWWDWGTKDGDLKDVEVWLPCWENGAVLDVPEDCEDWASFRLKEGANGGRPKLQVAEPESVEFEII